VSRALRQAEGREDRQASLLQFTTADHPLVVWNMTRRCNLRCTHCYNASGEAEDAGRLSTAEAKALIDDLAAMQVPVLLFSGGEPVLRDDLYELGAYATSKGLRAVLSTNGTLITAKVADSLAEASFQYVGVSIDGLAEVHDRFRGREGACESAWEGIRSAQKAGLRTGVRFTVTQDNVEDLRGVVDRAAAEGVDRFCLYHLVYSGRGSDLTERDLPAAARREMIEWLVERTEELHGEGKKIEILTTDNHADGVFLHRLIARRDPSRAAEVLELLAMHGGCSAGRKFANVDAAGDVHACQFWGHESLGNVREQPFSKIWRNLDHPLLCRLKESPAHVTGRCGECSYKVYCGGCRIRAEAAHGDRWGPDPACYLTDEEIQGDVG
jgi:radical SAM protein with 4Fe4S-binding SPASM domain